MVMHRVPTSIWEDGYAYSANKFMTGWLWIECQQVYERMVMHIVPTNLWQDGYE